jgi:hypothetical protein
LPFRCHAAKLNGVRATPEPTGPSLSETSHNGEVQPDVGHTGRRTDQLTPFNSTTARAAAQRSAEVRRARRRLGTATSLDVSHVIADALQAHERSKLGPLAAALAAEVMGRLLTNEIKLRGADVGPVLRALVDIARLEAGEATSATLVAHVDASAVAARVGELQRRARAALVAVTADVTDQGVGSQGSDAASPSASAGGDDEHMVDH